MNARWVKRSVVTLGLLGATAVASIAGAATPETVPTAVTSFPPHAPARTWIKEFDSTDPRERDSAIENLMGLQRDQLPALRALIVESKPLSAADVLPLHDIVVHVYLTGEPYLSDAGGFLGLRWLGPYFSNEDTRHDAAEESDTSPFPNYLFMYHGGFLGLRWPEINFIEDEIPRLGVPVSVRLPGFPCFRMLRDGDMIEGVLMDPTVSPNRLPNVMSPTRKIVTDKIGDAPPGLTVDLLVLRSGESIRVPITLTPRPILPRLTNTEVDAFFNGRSLKAEAYWNATFAPVCKADSFLN